MNPFPRPAKRLCPLLTGEMQSYLMTKPMRAIASNTQMPAHEGGAHACRAIRKKQ